MKRTREPHVVVSVSMPLQVWEALDKLRKATGRTMCDLLRTAASEYASK
jgi:predicted DNA-binding protein